MIKRIISYLAAILMLGGLVNIVIPDIAEAAPKPYHIRNSPLSNGYVIIFANQSTRCTPPYVPVSWHYLYAGDQAVSNGWDWFRPEVGYPRFSVTVYDGDTGAFIVKRNYTQGQCVQAYNANDYFVEVPFQ